MVSGGGGNTRLLIDYPEPYRSDILDYLFKPNYGASYTHLKVEVGGDVFSTTGTEPTHARTREELANPNMYRGYELWLMSEAKKRNSKIQLDILQWGAPGWINDFSNNIGKNKDNYYSNHKSKYAMYSQDNADYLVSYIQGAKRVWDLDIDYVGGNQNESFVGLDAVDPCDPNSPSYLKNYLVNILRPTLDRNGLQHVKIIAPDIGGREQEPYNPRSPWAFVDEVLADPLLLNAVSVIGYHYVKSTSTEIAQNSGLTLWESEGWTGSGSWYDANGQKGALELARIMNNNYIKAKVTKTNVWHMISSSYTNLSFPKTGVMIADEPWSGIYTVMPGVWAAAHTNQFAQPGWQYLDSGCGLTTGGTSYVTLKQPDGSGNYSVIMVTGDIAETMTIKLIGGLSADTVHVWKSNEGQQFIQQPDIMTSDSSYSINLEPNSIYSLTTTTGQQKGQSAHPIPAPQSFPRNYYDDFESYVIGETPKFTSDVEGVFEVADKFGSGGKALRQVVAGPMKQWDAWMTPRIRYCTHTQLGDLDWTDYDFSSDVCIESAGTDCYGNEKPGTVSIVGRAGTQARKYINDTLISGYRLQVDQAGQWSLRITDPLKDSDSILASGSVPFSANTWHHLKLSFGGPIIKGYIDNNLVASVTDNTYATGVAGLGSGYNYAQYDNISIIHVPYPKQEEQ
ncbi:galactosylceramidase [Paenibacillus marchantiophytorum]|uniref:galactosylceramidase n=1 Tax=Paenibacillus marchantiophytorum TaxID=1619310 RepID=A0ABQ1EYJ3_9BACL|nr:galactosylceramidase [Paenibacillus marchantiophytorum]